MTDHLFMRQHVAVLKDKRDVVFLIQIVTIEGRHHSVTHQVGGFIVESFQQCRERRLLITLLTSIFIQPLQKMLFVVLPFFLLIVLHHLLPLPNTHVGIGHQHLMVVKQTLQQLDNPL